ncbi:hypothetical protein V2L06_20685 [Pseudomonas alliivorans]|nr:hypothetical protein [Pseudomonas alliivorans]
MRKLIFMTALSQAVLASPIASADAATNEAAALLAFNAAELCHTNAGLYSTASGAIRDGHTEDAVREAGAVPSGSEADKVIKAAVADTKSGKEDVNKFYEQCMKKAREKVYATIEGGKIS